MLDALSIRTNITDVVAALPRPHEVTRARARLQQANKGIDTARAKAQALDPAEASKRAAEAAWDEVRRAEAEANTATREYREAIRSWTPAVHHALDAAHRDVAALITAAVRSLDEAMKARTHLAIETGKLGIEPLSLPVHLVDLRVCGQVERILASKNGARCEGHQAPAGTGGVILAHAPGADAPVGDR